MASACRPRRRNTRERAWASDLAGGRTVRFPALREYRRATAGTSSASARSSPIFRSRACEAVLRASFALRRASTLWPSPRNVGIITPSLSRSGFLLAREEGDLPSPPPSQAPQLPEYLYRSARITHLAGERHVPGERPPQSPPQASRGRAADAGARAFRARLRNPASREEFRGDGHIGEGKDEVSQGPGMGPRLARQPARSSEAILHIEGDGSLRAG